MSFILFFLADPTITNHKDVRFLGVLIILTIMAMMFLTTRMVLQGGGVTSQEIGLPEKVNSKYEYSFDGIKVVLNPSTVSLNYFEKESLLVTRIGELIYFKSVYIHEYKKFKKSVEK